jgi:uncharacterized protein (DUF924 family)
MIMLAQRPTTSDAVLDFWFGARDAAGASELTVTSEYGTERDFWFGKDVAFDTAMRARFGAAVDAAIAAGFADWTLPRPMLARILLLDQFPRNCFRGTPRAFAGDALALALARRAVATGADARLIAVERWFLYMPFVHAESETAQAQSLALFARLAQETGLAAPLPWAQRHAEVIRRFGRFPHRNEILQRQSTSEELAFLATPGSRF